MDKKKILVVGAGNLAGSLVARTLLDDKELIVLDAPPPPIEKIELVKPFKIPYKFKKTKRGTNMTPPKKKRKK